MEAATIAALIMTAIVGCVVVWMAVKSRTAPAEDSPASDVELESGSQAPAPPPRKASKRG